MIQRFGSAANLNIRLHGLVLDGVYQTTGECAPVFHEAPAPSHAQLHVLLDKIIKRMLQLLTRLGHLIEEEGVTYLPRTESLDPDNVIAPLQAASSRYRIAMGPRAGHKVLSLRYAANRPSPVMQQLCADAHGFSLHAGVCCETDDRKGTEQLCRYIKRPAIANERLSFNKSGQVILKLKTAYRNGNTHIVMTPMEFMQRLAALEKVVKASGAKAE